MVRKKKYLKQELPKKYALENGLKPVTIIPIEKVICFSFPEQLGGPKNILHFKQRLYRYYKEDPMFNVLDHKWSGTPYYNLGEHRRLYDQNIWTFTRKLEWPQRKNSSSDSNFTDYYYIRRVLLFKRNRIIFRDSILETLRDCFQSFGTSKEPINITFNLSPSIEDLDKAIEGWERGDFDFKEIMVLL